MPQRVRFAVDGEGLGTITLARPDKLNALDQDTFQGLYDAAEQATEAAASGRCRALLLSGEGRAFCAGLDVSLFGEQLVDKPSDDWIAWLQGAFNAIEDLPVPVVAAIHGVAVGGGCQLALAAHLRIAAPDARFGLLEARWALVPDLGATYRLPRLVGLSRATDLALTGRLVDADTALGWGLVDAVADGDTAWDQAKRLSAGPTTALGAVPALMRQNLLRTRDAALAADRAAQARCLASKDFREAVEAARAGRDPVFTGG
jgi:2-(1,2-epoxy-1,2-dihydrophenyl)acetyl-CoA isomerase